MNKIGSSQPLPSHDTNLGEEARHQLEQTKTGDTAAARKIDDVRTVDSAAADAVEQEASDGPDGSGLAR